eukprot:GGOE01062025.1.p1 GENE.GGOE01062025.1~~GGOE01062025.1.p1  ORF type:complete len:455 (+),score=154.51 GGOE01062025.1:29-1366(+)
MSGWGFNRGPAPRPGGLFDRPAPRGFGRSPPRDGRVSVDKVTVKLLMLYLEKKWDANTRMLDLSALRDMDDISELSPNLNNHAFCLRLAECVAKGKEWAKSLDSINLGSNRMYTLRHISEAFVKWEVRVQNLALADNRIAEFDEIDHLVPLRLREVILLNNPIAKQGNTYHRYVVKRLKTIQLLDMVSVTDWRKQMLPKMPEPADSCVTAESQVLLMRMMQLYFETVDKHDVESLVDGYDKDCFFSFTAEPTTKMYFGPARRYHDKMQTDFNHNLRLPAVTKSPARLTLRGRGPIHDFLKREMYYKVRTRHDVSKFKLDAVTMGDFLIATIHGSYSYRIGDDETDHKKSFDRVWILRPSNRSGTDWPARIVNDQLTWRTYQDQPIVMPKVTVPVLDVKAQLMAATRLNAAFAELLLRESGGQLEAALNLFKANQSVGSIPPQAFQ